MSIVSATVKNLVNSARQIAMDRLDRLSRLPKLAHQFVVPFPILLVVLILPRLKRAQVRIQPRQAQRQSPDETGYRQTGRDDCCENPLNEPPIVERVS